MKLTRTIGFRLSLAFVVVFFIVLWVGLFGLQRLGEFRFETDEVRDHWLYKTRYIGDLNNFTSDFRAAEATILLGTKPAGPSARQEIEDLDASIAQAERNYARLLQEPTEREFYRSFHAKWAAYRAIAGHVLQLVSVDHGADALAMFRTGSRMAYESADGVLGRLTALNNKRARGASTQAEEALRQARWLSAIALLIGSLMVLVALYYVRRSIAAPLRDLAGSMRRLAVNETDIDVPNTQRSDEIGEMARAVAVFRRNAIELLLSQRGLARQASMLEEKLAHEQHLTQLQRNFIAMASHEFVTPLTIIDGQAQRLINLKERLPSGQLVERAGKIRAAVARITHLINNLLASAKVVEGKPELYYHPAAFDLSALVREVCAVYRDIQPGATIVEADDLGPVNLAGDRDLLFQAVSNLLSNAIKYSPDGHPVKVLVSAEDGFARLVVTDRGIGIPRDDLGNVFARFYRGRNVAGIVGTGVGLYFVKTVMQLHGGTIDIQSEEGRGSSVTLGLPIVDRAESAADDRELGRAADAASTLVA